MKRILGLDLGTNSIGWALVNNDFNKKEGNIQGIGSRIIPMSQDVLGKFDSGTTVSQTADRTSYRGVRRLYQRDNLRRERLHRVLNILDFLPEHYAKDIDFLKRLGQFKPDTETKLPYRKDGNDNYHFMFQDSFLEMVEEFKSVGYDQKLPYDWTLYYLRKKALSKKITKEELAWVLLNFNQKRGYYQARGEEEEMEEGKSKEFVQLKVKDVINSGDEVKGNILYDVIFDNGWSYDKQITKTEDWIGKTREFIITQTVQKNGTIKRSFKKVDSEIDWIAIKEKSQQDIDTFNFENKTVGAGTYIFDTLLQKPDQKIRGKLVKTIERKYYREELAAILAKQVEEHPELRDQNLYELSINELYRHNDAHKSNIKDKGFKYLFVEDIIFYQRPLKSKKSTISNCPYETRTFIKDGKKEKQAIKCISKSNPLYQEFRLWQFIHNLKLFEREAKDGHRTKLNHDVTRQYLESQEDYTKLFSFLNTKAEISQTGLLRFFKLNDKTHRWNYVEDKKYPCNETRSEFIKRLSKIDGLDVKVILSNTFERELWHVIYSVRDKNEYVKALKTFAAKKGIDKDGFCENFEKFKPYDSAYGAYSEKAIKKLLPLMRRGEYWLVDDISPKVKDRITSIMERVKELNSDLDKIEKLADDDIPKQLLKSFVKTKDAFQGLNTYQACYAVYNRHSEVGDIQQWKKPEDIAWYLDPKNPKGFKQHSLRNPIVEQVVTETLRVVKDIWDYYGEGKVGFFNEIHVELGREMKNDKKTRKRISDSITENENTNERIKNILRELMNDTEVDGDIRPYSKGHQDILRLYEEGVYSNSEDAYKSIKLDEIDKIRKNNSPSKSEIIRYKLWLQQGYISPYTGDPIPLSRLFTTDYQIEHIIPRSRYFDDSMGNKVICESEVNALKDNQTAFEFIKNNQERIIDLGQGKQATLFSLDSFEEHCKAYFKGNNKKLKMLLSEDIPEGFISRQLNDSRYISKVVKGLLSNVVREEGEKEVTSKNLIPVVGSITSKMKKDWGLNDVWETLITPRFERMNQITDSNEFRKQTTDGNGNTYWINTVPQDLAKGFTKKRIDHRHHALDALVVALATRNHVTYLGNLNANERDKRQDLKRVLCFKTKPDANGSYKWQFYKPWPEITENTLRALETTVVSFKQDQRIINKTNNKTTRWEKVDGQWKKVLRKQVGRNWAIRKPMHKQTVYGKIDMPTPKGKIATAVRTSLSDITTRKRLEAITDISIQRILENHLKSYLDDKGKEQFDKAFGEDGIVALNAKIKSLNGGKPHQPIYKVRLYEVGVKFSVGEAGNNSSKYVEAEKGTNLFFNIYWQENKGKRTYNTVPLNEVIAHQKWRASLDKEDMKKIPLVPIDNTKGSFLFSLSPNDIVYIPNDEEVSNKNLVDFSNLKNEQVNRIYKMVKTSGKECYFIRYDIAGLIKQYDAKSKTGELGSQNKLITTMDINSFKIVDRCWKLKSDRLGNLKRLV
jgi:CRISPR-associated endonuclease Csn1